MGMCFLGGHFNEKGLFWAQAKCMMQIDKPNANRKFANAHLNAGQEMHSFIKCFSVHAVALIRVEQKEYEAHFQFTESYFIAPHILCGEFE